MSAVVIHSLMLVFIILSLLTILGPKYSIILMVCLTANNFTIVIGCSLVMLILAWRILKNERF